MKDLRQIAEKLVAQRDDGIEDWSGIRRDVEKALLSFREEAIEECAETICPTVTSTNDVGVLKHRTRSIFEVRDEILSLLSPAEGKGGEK